MRGVIETAHCCFLRKICFLSTMVRLTLTLEPISGEVKMLRLLRLSFMTMEKHRGIFLNGHSHG